MVGNLAGAVPPGRGTQRIDSEGEAGRKIPTCHLSSMHKELVERLLGSEPAGGPRSAGRGLEILRKEAEMMKFLCWRA